VTGEDDPQWVTLPAPESRRRPLGIGVLAVGARTDQTVRGTERLAVTMAAYRAGYHIVDLFEIDLSDGGGTDEAFTRIAVLARRTDAEAFFVRGPVDRALLEPIAAEVRMVIRDTEGAAETPVDTTEPPQ